MTKAIDDIGLELRGSGRAGTRVSDGRASKQHTRAMSETARSCPSRARILKLLEQHIYEIKILNNTHRGDVVEMMVLAALGDEWRYVGLGWHPWDLQKGTRHNRVRIQVKQSAAVQLWSPAKTRKRVVSLGWKRKPPNYFKRDHPNEPIEAEGWFCEVFVVGIHDGTKKSEIDQVDPRQWTFLVIPTQELARETDSISREEAIKNWPPVPWVKLKGAVDDAIAGRAPRVPMVAGRPVRRARRRVI